MQVSGTKIKTDWEKLQEEKNQEQIIIKNKPSDTLLFPKITLSKIEKNQNETSIVLNYFREFQSPKNLGFEVFFWTSFHWQKQLFENLKIDQNVISEFEKLCDIVMRETGTTLDAFSKFSQTQSNMFSNTIKMYNNFLEQGLDWYSKFMSIHMTKK